MNKTIFLNKEIEVLVVSSGGVGTTFLMDAIADFRTINSSENHDGFKHLPIPPLSANPTLKAIYVFGDPVMAAVSLFRRGYHHTQSHGNAKFQNFDYLIPEDLTLAEYAMQRKDGLYFNRHFDNWLKGSGQYPILFLKYDDIFDSLETIQKFLELPDSFVTQFTKKRERKSRLAELSAETISGLKEMYGDHQSTILQQPGTFMVEVNTEQKGYFTNKNYRNAFKEAFFKKVPLLRKVKNKFFKS